MINVRVPKDIRKFKGRFYGFTVREIVCIVLAIAICVPTYIFGRNYVKEDELEWAILFIAAPFAFIGFYSKNGLPFEKYIIAILKHQLIFPQRTLYKTKNFFHEMQKEEEYEEMKGIDKKKMKKYREKATLERAYLMELSEKNGRDIEFEQLEELLTVKKPTSNNNKNKKNDEKKEKQKKKSKAQLVYEEVEEKKRLTPNYVPTKKEGKMIALYMKEREKNYNTEMRKARKKVSSKNKMMGKRKVAKTYIPKSTQDDLPYIADYEEGLFEVGENQYSKCYELMDINYANADDDKAIAIFCKYAEFLSYFSEDMLVGITVDNSTISLSEQEEKICYPLTGDNYDMHREEYNKILKKQLSQSNKNVDKKKYVTVTIESDSPYEALLKFHKIDSNVKDNIKKIGSRVKVLSTDERLAMLHDKMRKGKEGQFNVNYNFLKEQGLSSKDYVAPSSFWFKNKNYFMIEDTYYRSMYINNLPAKLGDELVKDLTDHDFPVTVTLQIKPANQGKALNMIKKKLATIDMNIMEAQKKAVKNGYSPNIVNHDLLHNKKEGEKLLSDMMDKDQKMFYVSILVLVGGETLEELNSNVKAVYGDANKYTCQLQTLDYQQREGFQCTLPMGVPANNKIYVERALTTESTAVFMPFTTQELFDTNGHYIGINAVSRKLIMCDRTKMKTPSGFVLGSAGSGKSFACKRTMLNVILADDKTELLVIDPENEYSDFIRVFGGTVIKFSTNSNCHINPMDMDENYGLEDEDDPLTIPMEVKKDKALRKKTEYIMSIVQCMMKDDNGMILIKPQQKSIIDRCVKRTYEEYLAHNFDENYVPTLLNFQDELDKEKETEDGREIAEAIEYYTRGSMNLFSHKTNVNINNRIVSFNIRDLGKELKELSLLFVMDFIWNRMIANFQLKLRTYCFVDEIHVLFKNNYSEDYIQQLYKRGRKYGLVITGITQDISDLLKSDKAKTMLTNSDFVLMLNQKGENLESLSDMFKISPREQEYISNANEGCGLLYAEKVIIPFEDKFPNDSYLYTLMSTKFGEDDEIDVNELIHQLQEKQREREKEQLQSA